jgi:hypothetical protein
MRVVEVWKEEKRRDEHVMKSAMIAVNPRCCSGVAVVLQWCYSGVAVVLQWCCSGVTNLHSTPL